MPDIDTSPAALRALAAKAGLTEPADRMAAPFWAAAARDALRALAAEKEAADRVTGCEAAAQVLAGWLGYAWDGLHDRDISNRYPDWVYDGIGGKKFQGGRPALQRIAQAMLATVTAKPDLTVGEVVAFDAASRDAHLEIVREKDAAIADLRARLEAAERERDEAHEAYEKLAEPSLNWMRLENGQLDMAVAGAVVQHIAAAMAGWFRESGAENYVEMSLNARDEPFERYVVTVQKVGRLSPHEARVAAEARAEEAEAERDALAGPLTYGPYSCVPKHAVECAYLLSLAEAEYQRDPSSNAAEVLELYARGDVSIEEAMDALAAPDQPENPAHD